jgi:hypothetical protein
MFSNHLKNAPKTYAFGLDTVVKRFSRVRNQTLFVFSRNQTLFVFSRKQYLEALDIAWHNVPTKTPTEIWDDVTAFTKCSFWQTTKATEIHNLAVIGPFKHFVGNNPLFTVSQLSSSGVELGVLTVWPSK